MNIGQLQLKAYKAAGCKASAYTDADESQLRIGAPKQHPIPEVIEA